MASEAFGSLTSGIALVPPLVTNLTEIFALLNTTGQPRDFPDCSVPPLQSIEICNTESLVSQRASSLLDLLTLEEKLSFTGVFHQAVEHLGLPQYIFWNEALHGVATGAGVIFEASGNYSHATSFPQPILTAAAFDDQLVYDIASQISTEARAFGNAGRAGLNYWTPNINPFRDPRWGRGKETPGEDPFHVSSYTKALLSGLEGPKNRRQKKVVATCKHSAGYDLENWHGVDRFHFDAQISMQDLAEYYMPPFQACSRDAQVGAVMCSYNRLNGVPSCADSWLLQNLTRDHWRWNDPDQYVVGDCGTLDAAFEGHNFTITEAETASLALKAGMDLDCGIFFPEYLPAAVSKGLVTEQDIDQALHRQFSSLITLGYFDGVGDQYRSIDWSSVNTAHAKELAQRAASAGMTLLKNINKTLPLKLPVDGSVLKILICGDWANATTQMQGGYSGIAPYLRSPLEGLRALDGVDVEFIPFGNDTNAAIQAANQSDIVIFVGGIDEQVELEGKDRNDISWNSTQVSLIKGVAKVGRPTVIVQTGGGQLDNTAWVANSNISSILWAGYPGQAGGTALADILFGMTAPAGRLPVTQYPSNYTTVPMTDMSLRPDGGRNPGRTYMWYSGQAVFPFGFGLHYTNFSVDASLHGLRSANISELLYSCAGLPHMDLCKFASVRVQVNNIGAVPSDYVALAFLKGSAGPEPRPKKRLVAYERFHTVEPGCPQTLDLRIDLGQITRWNEKAQRVLYPGNYRIEIDVMPELAAFEFELVGSPHVIETWPSNPKMQ